MSQEIVEVMMGTPIAPCNFLTSVTMNIHGGHHSNSPTLTMSDDHHRAHDPGGG